MSKEPRLVSENCPYCKRYTVFSIERCHRCALELGLDTEERHKIKWRIGVCNNCYKPVIILNEGVDGQCIFPHPQPSESDDRIPENIRKDLDEAKICNTVGAFRIYNA